MNVTQSLPPDSQEDKKWYACPHTFTQVPVLWGKKKAKLCKMLIVYFQILR